jgi:hypothetical protein
MIKSAHERASWLFPRTAKEVWFYSLLRRSSVGLTPSKPEPDWVYKQALERKRRLLADQDTEYEQRLASARKREAALRKMAAARVYKKAVCSFFLAQEMTKNLTQPLETFRIA